MAQLIVEHGLTHEMVPTTLHGSPLVWRALLEQMPMTAMLRNLGRLTTLGTASASARALAVSTTAALAASSSLRHIVPWRLISFCQPGPASQASSRAAGTPDFLKSWNT